MKYLDIDVMRRMTPLLSLMVMIMLSITQIKAQYRGESTLSFERALEMTMESNPQVTALEHEMEAARHERKATYGLRLPQIKVSATYAYLGKDIGFDLNGVRDAAGGAIGAIPGLPPLPPSVTDIFAKDWGLTIQERSLGFVGGTVTMPIYTGGKINAANRAAKINERVVGQKRTQIEGALLSELVERYYGLYLTHRVVSVRKQVLNAVRTHLEDAISMEENGVIARSERLYMEVKMSEAQRELMEAELQVETMISALGNTLNDEIEYIPTSDMFMLKSIHPMEYFKVAAVDNNPQLRQVSLQKELAQQSVKAKRAEFLPQIALMGMASFYNYNISTAIPRWVVGAGVSINIFDGLHKEQKYKAARSVVRQVDAMQTQAENNVTVMVEKIYNEMRNYSDRMPSIESSLEFAQEYLRVKRSAFKEGMASSVDVIDAELNLAKTRIERLQVAYYYDVMLARLLEAAGESDQFMQYAGSIEANPIRFE